jgi:NhaA family Na+:H+ antiporter
LEGGGDFFRESKGRYEPSFLAILNARIAAGILMPINLIRQFLKLEAASGLILLIVTLAALIWSNLPLNQSYEVFFNSSFMLSFDHYQSIKPLSFWINEGLMTLFFLLIGLELKREFLEGELASVSRIVLPGVAALGGMIVPAVIYVLINLGSPDTLKGWPIPVATDIAFALGVLSLFGKKIPVGLRLFLMALAIFDDLGAILIIALYYTEGLSFFPLFFGGVIFVVLILLNLFKVTHLGIYCLLGGLLWFFILRSGVHPTIAGVLFALTMPLSIAKKVERTLHPWIAFFIMPLFALANAGVSFEGVSISILFDPVTLGIILGLFLGKQLGVFSSVYFVIKNWPHLLPKDASWLQVYGVTVLCGIGFTMSLFLGNLAFIQDAPVYATKVRLGVLVGSVASGMVGAFILYFSHKLQRRNVLSTGVSA